MGSTTDKIKGVANEAMGNVKQGVGRATGNEKLEAEGVVQEIKGETQLAIGKAKDAVKKTTDKVADAAHRNL
ncbi:MAG: CsbD family protein [Rhizobiales bacterium]|nr:CsbD family protein [Hyphomicrobiales bacterium]